MTVPLGQVQLRDRSAGDGGCVADNGFCPGWIADNFDRYVDPFFEHVVLTLVSLGIGFAISFGLALMAHRRRWLIGPVTQVTGILYTLPSLAVFFLLLPMLQRKRTVTLEPGTDGVAYAEVPALVPGLYRVEDGQHAALAASGPANPREFEDLRATSEHLADVVKATGGGMAWLVHGTPELRRTASGRQTSGHHWMGLRRNAYATVIGVHEVALFPPLLALGLALGGLAAAWWREGR